MYKSNLKDSAYIHKNLFFVFRSQSNFNTLYRFWINETHVNTLQSESGGTFNE